MASSPCIGKRLQPALLDQGKSVLRAGAEIGMNATSQQIRRELRKLAIWDTVEWCARDRLEHFSHDLRHLPARKADVDLGRMGLGICNQLLDRPGRNIG